MIFFFFFHFFPLVTKNLWVPFLSFPFLWAFSWVALLPYEFRKSYSFITIFVINFDAKDSKRVSIIFTYTQLYNFPSLQKLCPHFLFFFFFFFLRIKIWNFSSSNMSRWTNLISEPVPNFFSVFTFVMTCYWSNELFAAKRDAVRLNSHPINLWSVTCLYSLTQTKRQYVLTKTWKGDRN